VVWVRSRDFQGAGDCARVTPRQNTGHCPGEWRLSAPCPSQGGAFVVLSGSGRRVGWRPVSLWRAAVPGAACRPASGPHDVGRHRRPCAASAGLSAAYELALRGRGRHRRRHGPVGVVLFGGQPSWRPADLTLHRVRRTIRAHGFRDTRPNLAYKDFVTWGEGSDPTCRAATSDTSPRDHVPLLFFTSMGNHLPETLLLPAGNSRACAAHLTQVRGNRPRETPIFAECRLPRPNVSFRWNACRFACSSPRALSRASANGLARSPRARQVRSCTRLARGPRNGRLPEQPRDGEWAPPLGARTCRAPRHMLVGSVGARLGLGPRSRKAAGAAAHARLDHHWNYITGPARIRA